MTADLTLTETRLITAEEFALLPDLEPCELVEGRIVPVAPPGHLHGSYEINFGREISLVVRTHKLGQVKGGDVGILTRRNPDTVRGADVAFISNERMAQQGPGRYLTVAPDLIVEVVSPSNSWSDINEKIREYFQMGVRLIWIADPKPVCVYAYLSPTDYHIFNADDTLTGNDVLPGFSIRVSELFEL